MHIHPQPFAAPIEFYGINSFLRLSKNYGNLFSGTKKPGSLSPESVKSCSFDDTAQVILCLIPHLLHSRSPKNPSRTASLFAIRAFVFPLLSNKKPQSLQTAADKQFRLTIPVSVLSDNLCEADCMLICCIVHSKSHSVTFHNSASFSKIF